LLLSRLKLHDGKRASVGALRFPGAKRESAKWAAVSANTNMDDVFKLLTEVWHLEPPPVIISVTGAALGTIDELKSLPKLIFRRGLAEAARRNMEVQATAGEEIAAVVARAYASPPDVIARVRRISGGT
jgi:hypothetical protein